MMGISRNAMIRNCCPSGGPSLSLSRCTRLEYYSSYFRSSGYRWSLKIEGEYVLSISNGIPAPIAQRVFRRPRFVHGSPAAIPDIIVFWDSTISIIVIVAVVVATGIGVRVRSRSRPRTTVAIGPSASFSALPQLVYTSRRTRNRIRTMVDTFSMAYSS